MTMSKDYLPMATDDDLMKAVANPATYKEILAVLKKNGKRMSERTLKDRIQTLRVEQKVVAIKPSTSRHDRNASKEWRFIDARCVDGVDTVSVTVMDDHLQKLKEFVLLMKKHMPVVRRDRPFGPSLAEMARLGLNPIESNPFFTECLPYHRGTCKNIARNWVKLREIIDTTTMEKEQFIDAIRKRLHEFNTSHVLHNEIIRRIDWDLMEIAYDYLLQLAADELNLHHDEKSNKTKDARIELKELYIRAKEGVWPEIGELEVLVKSGAAEEFNSTIDAFLSAIEQGDLVALAKNIMRQLDDAREVKTELEKDMQKIMMVSALRGECPLMYGD